jgi:hypothetical protein
LAAAGAIAPFQLGWLAQKHIVGLCLTELFIPSRVI